MKFVVVGFVAKLSGFGLHHVVAFNVSKFKWHNLCVSILSAVSCVQSTLSVVSD